MFKTLAEAMEKAKIPPCVIAHTPGRVIDTKVGNYVDAESKLKIVTNLFEQPYSPVAGVTMTFLKSPTEILTKADIEKEMVSVGFCTAPHTSEDDKCSFEHRASATTAMAIAAEGHFHCVVCGHASEASLKVDSDEYKAAAELAKAEEAEAEEFAKTLAEKSVENLAAEASEDDEYLDDLLDESSSDSDESGDSEEGCEAETAEDIDSVLAEIEKAETTEEEPTETRAEVTRSDDVENPKTTTVAEEKPAPSIVNPAAEVKAMTVNIKATASVADWKAAKLALIPLKTEDASWLVLADYRPVGKMLKSKTHADLQASFEDKAIFPLAFQKAIEKDGLTEETATRFGFESEAIEVNVDSIVAEQVAEKVVAEKAALTAALEANKAVLAQAMSIAALQTIKGFEAENILRDTMISILKKNRVTAAEQLVDEAFEKAGKPWVAGIVTKAMELAKESDDSRNATAKLVEKASFQYAPIATTASVENDLGERLALGGSEVIEIGKHIPENREAKLPSGSTLSDRIMRATASLGNRRS